MQMFSWDLDGMIDVQGPDNAPFGSPSPLFPWFPQPHLASSPYNKTPFRNASGHIYFDNCKTTITCDYRIRKLSSRSTTCIPLALLQNIRLYKEMMYNIYIYYIYFCFVCFCFVYKYKYIYIYSYIHIFVSISYICI